MIFFVFSYNRGPLLKNCIQSIEYCAPGHPIIVYDDQSDDPETQSVLQEIAQRHEVRSKGDVKSKDQHGALYTNMQRAIDSVTDDETLFFIQDDAQLVRRIEADDYAFIDEYFRKHPKAGFLAPVFQKRITKQRTIDRFVFEPELGVFVCRHHSRKEVAGVFYSDISITTRRRLRDSDWKFVSGEYQNEQMAKAKFHEMGYLFAPLAMQLPNAPAYRNKKKSIAFSIAERLNRSGLYSLQYMPEDKVKKLKTRPVSEVPIAEDYLTTQPYLAPPWIFHPLRRSRLLRRFDELEGFIKSRLFRS